MFFQRFKRIDGILSRTVSLFHTGSCIVAIDATGYSSSYASSHYVIRMGMDYKKRKYIKSSVTTDTGNQIVVSQKARLGPRNDCLDSGKLLIETENWLELSVWLLTKDMTARRITDWLESSCMPLLSYR